MPRIDEKRLKGLKFHTSEVREVTKDGTKKKRHFPIERDLTPDDILSSRNTPDGTVIVTKDGRKYTPGKEKAGEKRKKEKAEGKEKDEGKESQANQEKK